MPEAVIAVIVLLLAIAALIRFNFIVVDRHVLWWQVAPILARGLVRNGREYRAVSYYVEQIFESGGFDRPDERKLVDQLNAMLAAYPPPRQ
jgi:hypothetical protein